MNCPKCNAKLRKASVSVEGASKKAASYQCSNCDFFTFERVSAQKALKEFLELSFQFNAFNREFR